jgi:hypothetical protein
LLQVQKEAIIDSLLGCRESPGSVHVDEGDRSDDIVQMGVELIEYAAEEMGSER